MRALARTYQPEILRIIGEESIRNGIDKISMREIEGQIRAARAERRKRG
jgi:hypothetical protein